MEMPPLKFTVRRSGTTLVMTIPATLAESLEISEGTEIWADFKRIKRPTFSGRGISKPHVTPKDFRHVGDGWYEYLNDPSLQIDVHWRLKCIQETLREYNLTAPTNNFHYILRIDAGVKTDGQTKPCGKCRLCLAEK